MNSFEDDKEKIISNLKQMPKVNDTQTKEALFQHISSQITKEKQPKRKRMRAFIPIFSSVLVVAILLIILPQFINDGALQRGEELSSEKIADQSDSQDSTLEKNTASDEMAQNDSDSESEKNESDNMMFHNDLQSKVINTVDDNTSIVFAAVPDKQAQYIIPISFKVPDTDKLDTYYNDLGKYLDEQKWGTGQYLISDDVEFHLDPNHNQVTMDIPDGFSIGISEAQATMFQNTLSAMFIPYQIDNVIFVTDDQQGVDLGSIGVMKELSINSLPKASYKVYQESAETKAFLVPVPPFEGDMNIQEALVEMKNDQKDYNVQKTMPENVDFSVTDSDQQLSFTFSEDTTLDNDQETVTMIEAILMTAKSYGYESVQFNQTNIDQLGPYELTKPIDVPLAANPIDIDA